MPLLRLCRFGAEWCVCRLTKRDAFGASSKGERVVADTNEISVELSLTLGGEPLSRGSRRRCYLKTPCAGGRKDRGSIAGGAARAEIIFSGKKPLMKEGEKRGGGGGVRL